jgi:hypothetical protein
MSKNTKYLLKILANQLTAKIGQKFLKSKYFFNFAGNYFKPKAKIA